MAVGRPLIDVLFEDEDAMAKKKRMPGRPVRNDYPPLVNRPSDASVKRRVGLALQRLREAKGWTTGDLEAASGVARAQIAYVERGARSCTFLTLLALARALGASLAEFDDPEMRS